MPEQEPAAGGIRERIKTVIIESLGLEGMTPEMIDDDAPLFGEGLGLDSVDALELMVVLEKDFGVQIDNQEIDPEAFASVAALERFIRQLQSAG
ncbi:MAG TPA: phosphopantetheine-binding protein [Thermoanaerobaculia bacterium]|nr:phosphopantetheine-binding protein [Thermoanaerobaculia bacterium]